LSRNGYRWRKPRIPAAAWCWLIACASALACASVQAGHVYRWKDEAGIVHYRDRAPAADAAVRELTAIPYRAEPSDIARLSIVPDGDGHLAIAENLLAGPIQVRLSLARGNNVASEPQLPARATLAAGETSVIARLTGADPRRDGDFALRLEATPGSPFARPREVEYRFPLAATELRIEQGYGGRYSHHQAQNYHAVDFAAATGTEVLAAREGVVMQIENDFHQAGLDREKYGGRANFVRVLHDDGTMAVYAHLRENGVMVQPGQHLRAGQPIGRSGNTGFTSGPHLHFVLQVNRGMRLMSIPFHMFGPDGILRFDDSQ